MHDRTQQSEEDVELLTAFSEEIANGYATIIHSDDSKWAQIAKWPCFSSGRVQTDRLSQVQQRDLTRDDEMLRVHEIRNAIHVFMHDAGLSEDSKVILSGDGRWNFGLNCGLRAVLDNAHIIFSLPQHVYLFAEAEKWCFCCMFEDYVFWGAYSLTERSKRRKRT